MIYFDSAATSYNKPKNVKMVAMQAINFFAANPGRSGHKLSQMASEKIFETREKIKNFFRAERYSVIFTKNCTEALNIAIVGGLKKGDHVITTCYEHNSVLRPLEMLKNKGVEVTILECDLTDFDKRLEDEIKSNTKMVITTFVSNVTGDMCNILNVSRICKIHNLKYIIDGAQAAGHVEINLSEIDADMFAFAGHKGLLGITGVGGLVVKNLSDINPIIYGGTGTNSENLSQPADDVEGFEAGTLPSISIMSLGAGIDFLSENFQKILKKEQVLCEYLYKKLKKLDFITNYSKTTSKNVFSFNVLNYDSAEVANYLNEHFSICVRAGLHCSPLVHKKIDTLRRGAVRVSLDYNNTFAEIDYLIDALIAISKI